MIKLNCFMIGCALLSLASCGGEEDNIRPADLPEQAASFINENRGDQAITQVNQQQAASYCYEVLLSNGEEFYFDCEGNFLFSVKNTSGGDPAITEDRLIPVDALPSDALVFLSAEFADTPICYVEMEEDTDEPYQYEVVLANGTEVYFDAEGNHLFTLEDDDYECA